MSSGESLYNDTIIETIQKIQEEITRIQYGEKVIVDWNIGQFQNLDEGKFVFVIQLK